MLPSKMCKKLENSTICKVLNYWLQLIKSSYQESNVLSKLQHVCVDPLCPSQQFFSYVRTISCIPGLNQYLAEDKVPCSRAKHNAPIKSRTSDL